MLLLFFFSSTSRLAGGPAVCSQYGLILFLCRRLDIYCQGFLKHIWLAFEPGCTCYGIWGVQGWEPRRPPPRNMTGICIRGVHLIKINCVEEQPQA